MDIPTPPSLLARLRDNPDNHSWLRFQELYSPLLRKWLTSKRVSLHDAEELTQEVLLTVSRELPTFDYDPSKGSFSGWLRTVLRHKLLPFWRNRKADPIVNGNGSHEALLEQLADPDSELSRDWDRQHNEHVAAQIQERVKGDFDPLTWKAFRLQMEEVPAAAVAAELGMSLDAVYQAKSRVLARLRGEADGLVD